MQIPLERLLDGCMETLREDVLADVGTRFARGQVWAVLDILHNLRDRIEPKQAPLVTEATSAAEALANVATALESEGHADLAGAVRRDLLETPDAPPVEQARALRLALVAALDGLAALPGGSPPAARAALAAHLGAQTLRDVSLLKPSLLSEISKG